MSHTSKRSRVSISSLYTARFSRFSPMRLILLTTAAMLLALTGAFAQPGKGPGAGRRLEKIEAARVAFLTNRLSLTTEQAQKFWPLYNEFDAKRRALRKRSSGRAREMATLADNQLQGAVDDLFAARQEELNLEKEYSVKFQKAITLRQLLVLYRSEREFTKFLLKKIEERRGGRPGSPAEAPLEAPDGLD